MRIRIGTASVSLLCAVVLGVWLKAAVGYAQSAPAASQGRLDPGDAGIEPPVMDNMIFGHVLFDQLEGRTNGPDNEFRWDGEGWVGTDRNKVWFKSEGFLEHGKATDGDTEAVYDRPIPFLRYFDAQAGVRYDLDSDPGALGERLGSRDSHRTCLSSLQPFISAIEAALPGRSLVPTIF